MSIRSRLAPALLSVSLIAMGGCASTKSSVPELKDLNISQILARSSDLSVTLGLLRTADMERVLAGANSPKYTLFAPTDAAWAAYGSEAVASLRDPSNRKELIDLLGRHVAVGEFPSRLLAGVRGPLKTRAKTQIEVDGSETDGFTVAGVPISQLNMKATNGYIHKVDGVLP